VKELPVFPGLGPVFVDTEKPTQGSFAAISLSGLLHRWKCTPQLLC